MPTTEIEWTDRAWPVVNGCRRVSPGCENCWAERLTATRLRNHPRYNGLAVYTEHGPRWTGERRMALDLLDEPLRVKKPQRWFVANKGDLFGEGVSNEEIAAVFGVMAAASHHTFQVLTKRPERMAEWFAWIAAELPSQHPRGAARGVQWFAWSGAGGVKIEEASPVGGNGAATWPLPNVWLGVSVEDQQRANERIPHLLRTPAAVRFISVEPLLGGVDLSGWLEVARTHSGGWMSLDDGESGESGAGVRPLHWVIIGGESGPGARPCALEWIEQLVKQCHAARVPAFVKQLGAYVVSEWRTAPVDMMGGPEGLRPEHYAPNGEVWAWRAGLKDPKGADPATWPRALRVRQFPGLVSR